MASWIKGDRYRQRNPRFGAQILFLRTVICTLRKSAARRCATQESVIPVLGPENSARNPIILVRSLMLLWLPDTSIAIIPKKETPKLSKH